MADSAIKNPLDGIRVGSIFTESGKRGATVLNEGLTTFEHRPSATMSMSGTSQYIYTDQMNQGSFTAAGSYGVSALAKISGAIAGYVGNTTAKSGHSLSINLNLMKWAGVEYIKFNEITAGELLAGLQSNAQDAATRALKAFVELHKADKDSKAKLLAEWIVASSEFYRLFGAGLVVGVLWGGWGTVKLEFTADNKESKWEGGGNASFSYAGAAAAVDVAATYGHTQDTIGQCARADLSYLVNGSCVEADIKSWAEDLQKKATDSLSKLGKEPVSHAAAMAGPVKPPKIPSFSKPEPEKKLTDLIGGIRSLEGLKAYAQAAAFEKQKEAGGTADLSEFLKSADKQNDVSTIPTKPLNPALEKFSADDEAEPLLGGHSGGDEPSGDEFDDWEDLGDPQMDLQEASGKKKKEDPKPHPAAAKMSEYEPMGIWTIPWGQLFPWLVSGQDNRVPQNAAFRSMLRVKTLHQDFLSLSSLYYRISTSGATLDVSGVPVDFSGISDAFSHGASVVEDFLLQLSGRPGKLSIKSKMAELFNGLRDDAKMIFSTWANVDMLRNCELGAGVLLSGPYTDDKFHTVSKILESHQVATTPSAFNHEKKNYEVFNQAIKGWPFVLPDGRVALFMSDGNQATSGFLTALRRDPMGVFIKLQASAVAKDQDGRGIPPADGRLFTFRDFDLGLDEPRYFRRHCISLLYRHKDTSLVQFHAIPFSAAKGIRNWKGSALTTGMGELPFVLENLRDDLAKLKSWSLDSDWWTKKEWKNFRYSMQMRPSYMGLVEEPLNLFKAE